MGDATEFIRHWCEFGEYRAYILMVIARRKFNEDLTHNSEIVHRRVLNEPEDVATCYRDLKGMVARYDNNFRMYLTVNARNTLAAYFNFREEMNHWSQDLVNGDINAPEKLGRVDSHWKSALHRPKASDDSLFLFDLDDVSHDQAVTFSEAVEDVTEHVYTRPTPNGYHVITKPFNYTEWDPSIAYDDMDTDGQLFVESF